MVPLADAVWYRSNTARSVLIDLVTAATHFPVWINHRGPASARTIWLASTNVCLLAGILAGYVVGGAARTVDLGVTISWIDLYLFEGFLMLLCGAFLVVKMERSVVDIDEQHHCPETQRHSNTTNMCELLQSLLGSVPFCLAVIITAVMSSAVVFALYFITQVCGARGLGEKESVVAITMIMVTAPAPGMLFGSYLVGQLGRQTSDHPAGGYTDHVATFSVALFSAIAVFGSALLFPVSWRIWGDAWQLPFVVACWGFFFFGGMTGPAMNGIAVSVIPRASHFASGLQFALANTAKIVVPMIGGWAIDQIGLVDGFNITAVSCTALFILLSVAGLLSAKSCEAQGYETLPS